MKRIIAATLIAGAMAGCAAQADRIKITASNYPEGIFRQAKLDAIRAKILDACTNKGYIVAEANTNTVVCTKETTGFEASMLKLAVSNAYSTTPIRKVRATLYEIGGDVKVTLSLTIESQMPFGQVRSIPVDNNDAFNEMQKMINDAGGV